MKLQKFCVLVYNFFSKSYHLTLLFVCFLFIYLIFLFSHQNQRGGTRAEGRERDDVQLKGEKKIARMKRRQRSKRKKMEGQKEVGPKGGQDANEGDEGGGEGEKDEDKESIAGEKVNSAEVHCDSEKVLEQEVRDNLRGCLIIDEDSALEKEEINSENCTIKVEDTEEVLDEVVDELEENPDESQIGSLEWQNQNREESYEAQENGREKAVSKIVDRSDTGEPEGNGEEEDLRKGIKEEVCSDESPVGSPMSPMETSPSTSAVPQENVVAQLNQLQQTVVSHILQYQAGVMAQFQQVCYG